MCAWPTRALCSTLCGQWGEAAGREEPRRRADDLSDLQALGVERPASNGEVVLTYNFEDWIERCRYQRGDPVLCANLMPTILELLPEKATPFRSEVGKRPT
jgi:hypothetical protein